MSWSVPALITMLFGVADSAGPTAAQYAACNAQAAARITMAPRPSPGTAAAGTPASRAPAPDVVSPPGAPSAAPPYLDRELLERADPAHRHNEVFRRTFLECMRRQGY